MTSREIALLRLRNQHIGGLRFKKPTEVVRWLGAVQAQDYFGALWAIGLRALGATEQTIESAIADRTIVRTWPMRGTLHLVASADVRWMLDHLTPAIIRRSALRARQLRLDEATFARSRKLFVAALEGGRRLTRDAMYRVLEESRISSEGQRGIHILWRLAQEGILCFGPREGKQQTFVLLDEWLPNTKTLPRDEALSLLAHRYFASRGPATAQDFAWWSGLSAADARSSLESARSNLREEVVANETFWYADDVPPSTQRTRSANLLPAFDEYLVGYKNRSAVLDKRSATMVNAGGGILNPTIVLRGKIVGTWKRVVGAKTVEIEPKTFVRFDKTRRSALERAAKRYGRFLNLPVVIHS